jgi:8-oxo-dGTP pyrophosphatase MutT (NUDIX family)
MGRPDGAVAQRRRAQGRLSDWPALRAAGAHDASARAPLRVDGRVVGSVAHAHLQALRAWPQWLQVDEAGVALLVEGAQRSAVLAQLNASLRAMGLIRAWRDETFALFDPADGARLASMERAAARFWGTLTLGAHANGYVADATGRPTHLWIAQRSFSKATDPGLFDNLVGGGVPEGQTPLQALVREGWEEAGLHPGQMAAARAVGVLRLMRDIPEGLQHEWLHAYDLQLPTGLAPRNQDGEVAGFRCLPLDQALALAAGTQMTVDAALVTLDFALRHALLPQDQARHLQTGLAARRVDNGAAVQVF